MPDTDDGAEAKCAAHVPTPPDIIMQKEMPPSLYTKEKATLRRVQSLAPSCKETGEGSGAQSWVTGASENAWGDDVEKSTNA